MAESLYVCAFSNDHVKVGVTAKDVAALPLGFGRGEFSSSDSVCVHRKKILPLSHLKHTESFAQQVSA